MITMKEIAELANVSQSTVSRSLNNSPLISEETKKKVLKIAEEGGFQLNANARGLSANKTYTIAVVFPTSLFDKGLDFHFRSWQSEIIESLEKKGLDVIVTFFENRFNKNNNIKRLIATKKVDGLIILEPNINRETIDVLEKTDTPFVFCKYLPSYYRNKTVDYVCVNQFEGGYIAGEHLIKSGHRKILCISTIQEGEEFVKRTHGFKSALKDHGILFDETYLLYGDGKFKSGYEMIARNLNLLEQVTAIFAQNDLMALGAISALNTFGYNVPKDISVIGFDDIDLCTFYKPYLTTIHQPTKEIAALTCEKLVNKINLIENEPQRITTIPPKLIIRDSTQSIH